MPKQKVITTYKFEELPEAIRQQLIEKEQNYGFDYDWWEAAYDTFEEAGELMGIEFHRRKGRRRNGDSCDIGPEIWFSGFSHQGSGLCYSADYEFKRSAIESIKSNFPKDEELHKIAKLITEIQAQHKNELSARITAKERYQVINVETFIEDEDEDFGADLTEPMEDFQHWMFKSLEKEYEYLTSEENIVDYLTNYDWDYDESGRII